MKVTNEQLGAVYLEVDSLEITPQQTHFTISPEDYTEFMKWKDSHRPKLKPIELVKCLMENCNNFNDWQLFSIEDYYDYELVCKDYGQFDIIKATYEDDGVEEDILFIGHWNDGVTE